MVAVPVRILFQPPLVQPRQWGRSSLHWMGQFLHTLSIETVTLWFCSYGALCLCCGSTYTWNHFCNVCMCVLMIKGRCGYSLVSDGMVVVLRCLLSPGSWREWHSGFQWQIALSWIWQSDLRSRWVHSQKLWVISHLLNWCVGVHVYRTIVFSMCSKPSITTHT